VCVVDSRHEVVAQVVSFKLTTVGTVVEVDHYGVSGPRLRVRQTCSWCCPQS
jgi:hypothetical protein